MSILKGTEAVMGVTAEHLRASYATYTQHGNTSSVSVLTVLDRLRSKEMDAAGGGRVRDHVVSCAFGPGVTVEMCMLKRVVGLPN
jgi:type III polyketide synthase